MHIKIDKYSIFVHFELSSCNSRENNCTCRGRVNGLRLVGSLVSCREIQNASWKHKEADRGSKDNKGGNFTV